MGGKKKLRGTCVPTTNSGEHTIIERGTKKIYELDLGFVEGAIFCRGKIGVIGPPRESRESSTIRR